MMIIDELKLLSFKIDLKYKYINITVVSNQQERIIKQILFNE